MEGFQQRKREREEKILEKWMEQKIYCAEKYRELQKTRRDWDWIISGMNRKVHSSFFSKFSSGHIIFRTNSNKKFNISLSAYYTKFPPCPNWDFLWELIHYRFTSYPVKLNFLYTATQVSVQPCCIPNIQNSILIPKSAWAMQRTQHNLKGAHTLTS